VQASESQRIVERWCALKLDAAEQSCAAARARLAEWKRGMQQQIEQVEQRSQAKIAAFESELKQMLAAAQSLAHVFRVSTGWRAHSLQCLGNAALTSTASRDRTLGVYRVSGCACLRTLIGHLVGVWTVYRVSDRTIVL
jgi:hypothetical protein